MITRRDKQLNKKIRENTDWTQVETIRDRADNHRDRKCREIKQGTITPDPEVISDHSE